MFDKRKGEKKKKEKKRNRLNTVERSFFSKENRRRFSIKPILIPRRIEHVNNYAQKCLTSRQCDSSDGGEEDRRIADSESQQKAEKKTMRRGMDGRKLRRRQRKKERRERFPWRANNSTDSRG